MSKSTATRRLLVTATTVLLMLGTTTALAQRSAEERRGRQSEQRNRASAAPVVEKYPQATREQPNLKATARGGPKLQKLSKAYEDDDIAAARPIVEELLADDKTNAYEKAIAARLLGALLANEDGAEARVWLQKALDFNGLGNNEHYETMLIIAQLQMQDEEYEAGLATLDRLQRETATQLPDHQALRGNALFRLERYPEAIEALKSAMAGSEEPRNDWAQLLMAAYAEADQPAEAAKLAEELAARAPDDKRSQMNLAIVYMQSGQDLKAAEVFERLRAKGELTEDRDYRNLMALYLNSDNKEREAIAVINEGLEKGVLQGDHRTYVALAQAYYFSDQVGPAIEAYRKAAPLAPDGEAYLNLARVLHGEGRLPEAKEAARKALDKGVRSPQDANRILSQK